MFCTGSSAIGAAIGVSCEPRPASSVVMMPYISPVMVGRDTVISAMLAVTVGHQIDEAGLVGHRDLAELAEGRIQPLAFPEQQGRAAASQAISV